VPEVCQPAKPLLRRALWLLLGGVVFFLLAGLAAVWAPDQPVEALLAARFDRSVDRERVCEIGHLCGTGHGIGRRLFPLLACWMHEQGIEWAVFAATSTLRQMFERMQVRPLPLAPATGERLGAAMADWGSYYDTDPWVVGGPLKLGQRLMDLPR